MNNEMERKIGQEVEIDFNSEMKNFANILNGTVFDYFYIDNAKWDKELQELFITLKILPSESEALTQEGVVKYIEFKSQHTIDYFSAQVNKDKQKLDELSVVFREENEDDMIQEVYKYMLNKFNEVKTIDYNSGSKMSVDIEFEDVELFEVGRF